MELIEANGLALIYKRIYPGHTHLYTWNRDGLIVTNEADQTVVETRDVSRGAIEFEMFARYARFCINQGGSHDMIMDWSMALYM